MNEQKIQGKIINSEQIKGKICTNIDYIINSGRDTSDATAIENDVLYGKTAYGANGKITGSMPNNGNIKKTLDALTVSYIIPEGYHNGNGEVNIDVATVDEVNDYIGTGSGSGTGIDTSDATAISSDILKNKTAYVNGIKIIGSMTNNGTVNKTLDTSMISYTIPKGYHSGSGEVNIITETKSATPTKSTQTINPTSGKVLSSVSINPIPDNYIDTSDATAVASNIQSGKTAYVNGSKITGTHTCDSVNLQSKSVTPSETAQTVFPDSGYDGLSSVSVGAISNTYIGSKVTKKSAATYTPNTTDQTIANGQYLSGTQTIKGDSNLVASNIKNGVSIFGVNGTYTPTLQSKTVTPTKSSQSISPDTNYDGLSSVIVNAIPDNYIDTSDATATAQDMASGATAYVNGEKVTGVARTITTYTGYRDIIPQINLLSGTKYICLNSPDMDANGILFKEGSHFYLGALPSTFGDATASDVAKGKTFTSSAGLKVTGTLESGSSDNNCEAYIVDVTNPVVNFQTATGTIKAWGYALGTTSGYTTPRYGFIGTQYKKVSSYGSDTTTDMSLSVDDSGNLTGLPSGLASGTILVTRGI